jgi:hypothetical protein
VQDWECILRANRAVDENSMTGARRESAGPGEALCSLSASFLYTFLIIFARTRVWQNNFSIRRGVAQKRNCTSKMAKYAPSWVDHADARCFLVQTGVRYSAKMGRRPTGP